MKFKLKNSGFTLIELLVAISIVAILSAIAIMILSGTLTTARNKKRIRDLQTIKQALELYRNDTHYYPASLTINCGTNVKISSPDGAKGYLDEQIQDPACGSRSYKYIALPEGCTGFDCGQFALCIAQEGASSSIPPACDGKTCGSTPCNAGLSSD